MGLSKFLFFLPRRFETFLNFVLIFIISAFFFTIFIKFYELPQISEDYNSNRLGRFKKVSDFSSDVILHVRPDYSIPREGPGENGKAVKLSDEENKLVEGEMKKWFMNMQAK
uniref:Uncharacterized protein n=1 Tax=Parastrongyloides trichosuri TaxID=131310 RepID=A0A0N4Z1X2_PARTI